MTAPPQAEPPTVAGAIDVDAHVTPVSVADLEPHLDDYWREFIADSGLQLNGLPRAYPPGALTSGATELATGARVPGTVADLDARLISMTAPSSVVLTCVTPFESPRNPLYAAAIARATNEWLRTGWLDRDDRLRGSVSVSTAEPEAAVAEIDRVGGDSRFVQVLLPVRSETPYGHRRWLPVFEAAARNDLVVALHAWGPPGYAPTPTGYTGSYLEDYLANAQVAQLQLASLVTEGTFVRLPELKVVLLECGFSWLTPFLWRFDKDWKGLWRETPWVKERPSAYIRRHVRASTQPAHLPADPEDIRSLVASIGPEWLLYASDYPHDHGPGQRRLLAALDEAGRDAVLYGNAAVLYGSTS